METHSNASLHVTPFNSGTTISNPASCLAGTAFDCAQGGALRRCSGHRLSPFDVAQGGAFNFQLLTFNFQLGAVTFFEPHTTCPPSIRQPVDSGHHLLLVTCPLSLKLQEHLFTPEQPSSNLQTTKPPNHRVASH